MNITINEVTRADLCTEETVLLLLALGSAQTEYPLILANIMGVLRNFTDSESLQEAVWAGGDVMKWIVGVLLVHSETPPTVESFCVLRDGAAVLRNFGRMETKRGDLQDTGAIDALVSIVRHVNNSQAVATENTQLVLAEALGALYHLAGIMRGGGGAQNSDAVGSKFKDLQVAELTMKTVDAQIKEEAVVQSGCSLLRCIAQLEHENRGLCQKLVAQMYKVIVTYESRSTATSQLVIGHAAGVLWSCLSLGQDLQRYAGEEGAAAILKAVQSTKDDSVAHESALGALRQFVMDNDNTIVQDNACTVSEDGAVQLCAEAMKAHSASPTVVARSAGVLQAIAASEYGVFVSARGGLGGLVAMLSKHVEQPVCEPILAAIGSLADGKHDVVVPLSSQIVPLVTKALLTHTSIDQIQIVGLTLLRNISVDGSAQATIEKTKDTIKSIVAALVLSHDPCVHEAAAGVMWSLAAGRDESKVALFKADAIPNLLRVLESSKTIPFQICAFGALSQITAYYDAARLAVSSSPRIIDLANTALAMDSKNAQLQVQVYNVLRNICGSSDSVATSVELLAQGVLEQLNERIHWFSSEQRDTWVQTVGHQLLWTVCSTNMSAVTNAVKGGAYAFALEKAKEHHAEGTPEAARVQAAAFGCICTLIQKDPHVLGKNSELEGNLQNLNNTVQLCTSAKPESTEMLCSAFAVLGAAGRQHLPVIKTFKEESGNAERVLTAMRQHATSPELQMVASTVCMLMAKEDTTYAQKIAEELDGINPIIAAVKAYPDDARVQSMSFEALWQIALCTSTRDTMVLGDIIVATCKAMRKHRSDRDVQEFACRLLWALMFNNVNNQKAINQDGAQRLVIGAMKTFAADANVQAAGALAVSLLSNPAFPDVVGNIVKEGVVPILSAAMKLQLDNEELQRSTCEACLAISGGPDAVKQVLINEGCFALMTAASKKHSMCIPLLESSTTAMCNCATLAGKSLADDFMKADGPAMLADVIKQHADHATLQRNCAMLSSVFE